MTIIGITGGTGGGKTSALRALQSLGALVIDCDALYHELLLQSAEMIGEINSRFEGVVMDGTLDRKALGKIVFSDSTALSALNEITHKFVMAEVRFRLTQWEDGGGTLAAIDAIALIESGLGVLCSIIVGVTAPFDIRVGRIMARDGLSEEYAKLRINAQKPDSYFYDNCDYVLISDSDTVEQFEEKCVIFFKQILGGATYAGA